MPYIGLDVGTSGCKASVVDGAGRVLAQNTQEYPAITPAPGYMELDANAVWAAVRRALKAVARPDITALAIASIGEAVVLADSQGEPLANSIYYSDVRGSEEVKDILAALNPREAERITGSRANPMFSANKLLWIKKHQPELYKRAAMLFLFGDYIGYRLTGKRKIDYSLASRTMLFDVRQNRWSPELMGALGLDEARFSEPVRAGSIVGPISAQASRELGLPATLTVVAGGHDQVMAALGSGAVDPGDSVDGMGSSECITLVLDGESWSPRMAEFNFCCEPHVFENTFVTLAFNASGGSTTRWYCETFEPERRSRLGGGVYAELDAECPAGPTSLFFLPHVAGSGTPHLDSTLGGAVLGLTLATTRAEIYKAALEGQCFEMRYNAELLAECGLELGGITAVGGAAKSRTLMQIKADIMGRRVETLASAETGTIGLALLCAHAMGDVADLKAAAKAAAARGGSFEPDAERAQFYSQRMQGYRRIYAALKGIYA